MITEPERFPQGLSRTLFDYPAAVDRGSFRFISGLTARSVGKEPDDWISLAEREMNDQADHLFQRVAMLTEDSGGLRSVMRLHLFQKDKRYFPVLERKRFNHEGDEPAPSSGLGLSILSGGRDCVLEVDGIVLSARGKTNLGDRAHHMSVGAGQSASYYAQLATAGPYVFLAGMIPINTATGKVPQSFEDVDANGQWMKTGRSHPDSRTGPIAAQAWTVYQQVLSHLEKVEVNPSRLSLVTAYIQHAGDAADLLRVHQQLLGSTNAALQMICVDEVGHKGTLLEIECTAVDGSDMLEASDRKGIIPRLASAGELVFISDCLGLSPMSVEGNLVDIPHQILAALRPANAAESAYLKQTWRALENLRVTLQQNGLEVERNLAHLWIRVVRPFPIEKCELIRHLLFGVCTHAVTISQVPAIPQSPRATVSVSGTASQESE